MIITDHHSLGRDLPEALAVITPNAPTQPIPNGCLPGWDYLSWRRRCTRPAGANGFDVKSLLDLVALGTVADLAPLLGENRLLVRHGLEVLNSLRRPGVAALSRVAGLKPGRITAGDWLCAGPRLNAAGRLSTPMMPRGCWPRLTSPAPSGCPI